MTDQNNTPLDDGDRTAGGGIIDPRTDGTTGSGGNGDGGGIPGGTTHADLSVLMDDEGTNDDDDLGEAGGTGMTDGTGIAGQGGPTVGNANPGSAAQADSDRSATQGNDQPRQTGVNEVVNGRFGSDVD